MRRRRPRSRQQQAAADAEQPQAAFLDADGNERWPSCAVRACGNLWATWCAPCVKEMPALDAWLAALDRQACGCWRCPPTGGARGCRQGFYAENGIEHLPVAVDKRSRAARAVGSSGCRRRCCSTPRAARSAASWRRRMGCAGRAAFLGGCLAGRLRRSAERAGQDVAHRLPCIATFNVENLGEPIAPGRRWTIDRLRPQLLRLRADVLCLQEVDSERQGGKQRRLEALDALLADTPYQGFHRASTVSRSTGHFATSTTW